MRTRTQRLSALLVALATTVACASLASFGGAGCGPADTTGDPEEADGGKANPAAATEIGDPGLGDKSPGQPSPWDRLEGTSHTQSTPADLSPTPPAH